MTLSALDIGQGVDIKDVDSTSALGSRLVYSLISDPSFEPEFFVIDPSKMFTRFRHAYPKIWTNHVEEFWLLFNAILLVAIYLYF